MILNTFWPTDRECGAVGVSTSGRPIASEPRAQTKVGECTKGTLTEEVPSTKLIDNISIKSVEFPTKTHQEVRNFLSPYFSLITRLTLFPAHSVFINSSFSVIYPLSLSHSNYYSIRSKSLPVLYMFI